MSPNQQYEAIMRANRAELGQLGQLAIGRLVRLGSRPFQEGDLESYADARAVLMAVAEAVGKLPEKPRDRISMTDFHAGIGD